MQKKPDLRKDKGKLPPYADYILTDDEYLSQSSEEEKVIEHTKVEAFKGYEEIEVKLEPLTQEYTTPTPKPNPSKKQKKK